MILHPGRLTVTPASVEWGSGLHTAVIADLYLIDKVPKKAASRRAFLVSSGGDRPPFRAWTKLFPLVSGCVVSRHIPSPLTGALRPGSGRAAQVRVVPPQAGS